MQFRYKNVCIVTTLVTHPYLELNRFWQRLLKCNKEQSVIWLVKYYTVKHEHFDLGPNLQTLVNYIIKTKSQPF